MSAATGAEAPTPRRPFRVPFVARILAAMALGALVGRLFGAKVERLGEAGKVIIDLIKALAGPLLFLAVVDAFLRTEVRWRSASVMLAITLTNALVAIAIGLTLSNTIRPGDRVVHASAGSAKALKALPTDRIDFLKELESYLPRNVVQPFLQNSVISIIVLALLVGWALRRVKRRQIAGGERGYRAVEDVVSTLFQTVETMLGGVILFVPVAVFGVVAQAVGQGSSRELVGLIGYVGVALLGLAIQVFVVYQAWVVLAARMPLRRFWSGSRDAVVYAMGSSSSLATLPVTLRCLDRMKVSPESARLAACVGTNLNNDGILLYEAMAVLFVAQYYGITLTFGQQLLAAASCLIAGIGIAAVPDAGLISLALVLSTVGLPVEIVPLLLTVDWLLSRARAMTNVTSDILVAVLLDRFRPRAERVEAVSMNDETRPSKEAGPVGNGLEPANDPGGI